MKAFHLIIILFALSLGCRSFADEVPCLMRLGKEKVSPGKQVQLELELPEKFGTTVPEMPITNGIDIQFIRSYQMAAQSGASPAKIIVFVYKAVPRNAGKFTVGPFTFQAGADIYRTNQLNLTVEKEEPRVLQAERPQSADLRSHIYVAMDLPKTTIYINEKVPVSLKLYTNWIDLENVSFIQKQSEYLLVKEFKDKTVEMIDKDSQRFAVLKYTSTFYAVTAGAFNLESVSVKFNVSLPQKDKDGKVPEPINSNSDFYESFIGNTYSRAVELESESVNVTVLPFPDQDKPKSFRGAVGKFQMELKADRKTLKQGESVKLTATVTGDGNYDALNAPAPADMTGIKVRDPKTTRGADSVAFDMQLTIDQKNITSLPDIVFSYFDPVHKKYITRACPIPVKLEYALQAPLPQASTQLAGQSSEKRADTRKADRIKLLPIKDAGKDLCKSAPLPYGRASFWVAIILPLILISGAIVFGRRQRYLKCHPRHAALLRAIRISDRSLRSASTHLREGDAEKFYRDIFQAMQEYIGERSFVPSAGVTGQTVDEYIEPFAGKDMAVKVKGIFSGCYSARYATSTNDRDAMSAIYKDVRAVIMELNKNELGGK